MSRFAFPFSFWRTFSPIDLKPQFFVEGDLGVTYPGGVPPNVLGWADQSGHAHDVSVQHPTPFQATEAAYLNQLGIEGFTGTATLQTTTGWLGTGTGWTFSVANSDGLNANRTAFDGADDRMALIYGTTAAQTITAFATSTNKIVATSVDPTLPHAVFIAWNSASSSMIVDSTGSPIAGDLTLASSPNGFLIGNSDRGIAGDSLHGAFMTMTYGLGTLSAANIARMFAWAKMKYGTP